MSIHHKPNKLALACMALAGLAASLGSVTSAFAAPNFPITSEHRKLAEASKDGVDEKWLSPKAPSSYTVKSGDTLWKVAGVFLKSPWRWPALWGLNMDDVRNPHLIYPGEVLHLVMENGKARLSRGGMSNQVVRLSPSIRVDDQISKAIPTIPYASISPFLTKPAMVDDEQFANSGRVFATKDDRLNVGTGGRVFATGLSEDARVGQVLSLYRPGRTVRDPDVTDAKDPKGVLGVEAVFLGEAKLVAKTAQGVATLEIINASQEIGRDDRVLSLPKEYIFNFAPHAAETRIDARVVMMHDGRTGSSLLTNKHQESRIYETEGGTLSMVVLNRGAQHGLELGHVMDLKRPAQLIKERSSMGYHEGNKVNEAVEIPGEQYGRVMVFKTFSNISYAIVMEASTSVFAGDNVISSGHSEQE